jgi:hypothetical protein
LAGAARLWLQSLWRAEEIVIGLATGWTPMRTRLLLGAASILCGLHVGSLARAQSAGDLAKAAQNPIASMISLPIQNNLNFGVGSHSWQVRTQIQFLFPK